MELLDSVDPLGDQVAVDPYQQAVVQVSVLQEVPAMVVDTQADIPEGDHMAEVTMEDIREVEAEAYQAVEVRQEEDHQVEEELQVVEDHQVVVTPDPQEEVDSLAEAHQDHQEVVAVVEEHQVWVPWEQLPTPRHSP